MSEDKKVRVAIIGAGNCASSLVQGLYYYQNAKDDEQVPGLMHVNLGGYHISDIEIVAAFDVVEGKVGKDLSEALFAYPNNTYKFCDIPFMNVPCVHRGMTHDGLGKYLSQIVHKAPGPTDDVVGILKETQADMLINYLPVGSEMAIEMVHGTSPARRRGRYQLRAGFHCQFALLVSALSRSWLTHYPATTSKARLAPPLPTVF